MSKKKNIFEERENSIEEIREKYFQTSDDLLPIIFKKMVDEYNVRICGVDLLIIQKIKNIKRACPKGEILAGLTKCDSEALTIYYNNNGNISVGEQRFIICYLFLKFLKEKNEGKKTLNNIETLQSIHKSDYPFEDMSMEEFNDYMINKNVRDIMMPSNLVDVLYNTPVFSIAPKTMAKKMLLDLLSESFALDKEQVKLRLKEVGLEKGKIDKSKRKKYNFKKI